MEPKTRQQTLTELRDETQYKLLEATAMLRSQQKVAAKDPQKVVKEVMDTKTMQPRAITITEMVTRNTEAVESLQGLLQELDLMLEEEKKAGSPIAAGVEKH